MYLLLAAISIILFIILFFFASPKLSPIPYFPSNKKDLDLILKTLGLKSNQVIIDLGAGSGFIIFEAAKLTQEKKLNTQFIAVEINPILYLILRFRRFFHKNKKSIKIIYGNMFSMNYSKIFPKHKSQITFYLYISPWFLKKAIEAIQKYRKDFYIISYMYAIPNRREVRKIKGKNDIYVYKF